MKINADIVNPFIEAGINVIKELTNIDVRRGHLTYRVTPAPPTRSRSSSACSAS